MISDDINIQFSIFTLGIDGNGTNHYRRHPFGTIRDIQFPILLPPLVNPVAAIYHRQTSALVVGITVFPAN